MLRSLFVSVLTLGALTLVTKAEVVTITTPTVLAANATTIGTPPVPQEQAEVVVIGTTLTVNGAHTFASLSLQTNAAGTVGSTLNHTSGATWSSGGQTRYGLAITVLGNMTIQSSCSANASGAGHSRTLGFGPNPGTGSFDNAPASGGGHGGAGGFSNFGVLGGLTDGLPQSVAQLKQPTMMGSSGGTTRGDSSGSQGGGVIFLDIRGTLQLDGSIQASGLNGALPHWADGGGAGGSIWISAAALSGIGSISANGGNGAGTCCGSNTGYAGGGGGGRIAVYAPGLTALPSNWTACGGSGGGGSSTFGGAGTIYLQSGTTRGMVYASNCGNGGEATVFTGDVTLDASLTVAGAALVGPTYGDPSLHLRVRGNAIVESSGRLGAPGRGFSNGQGPGAGQGTINAGPSGGGGHGGIGGNSSNGRVGGTTHDSADSPLMMGSSGGSTRADGLGGGSGGGVLRVTVGGAPGGGTLTVNANGAIDANGAGGIVQFWAEGGGAGGSLWITAPTIAGAGIISANGGNGAGTCCGSNTGYGGGGSGGRVAVYSCNQTMSPANIRALGGNGGGGTAQSGQPGTVRFGASSILITTPPQESGAVLNHTATLSIAATETRPPSTITYQWRRRNAAGEYLNLTDGQDGRFSGVATTTLSVLGTACDVGVYDCLMTDACGIFPSDPVRLHIYSPADFDNGTGTGVRDDAVTLDDLLYYLDLFAAGDSRADIDDGSAAGTQDGGVTIDDLLYFLNHYDLGC